MVCNQSDQVQETRSLQFSQAFLYRYFNNCNREAQFYQIRKVTEQSFEACAQLLVSDAMREVTLQGTILIQHLWVQF